MLCLFTSEISSVARHLDMGKLFKQKKKKIVCQLLKISLIKLA